MAQPQPFAKRATTYLEQVALLRSRGMEIEDEARAVSYLQQLNYYRLAAYWLPLEANHSTHQFQAGTSFETVLERYLFDRELRLLLMDAIERIEVSVRSQWAYEMAHRHGPHGHLDPSLAKDHQRWLENFDMLKEEVGRARRDERFIDHLMTKYSEPLPPVWAVCEVMSLGLLSRWYHNLAPGSTRDAIALPYGVDQKVLESWLDHLRMVRNLCAHHRRVWDREFSRQPMLPQRKPPGLRPQFQDSSRKVFNTLVLVLYLMDRICPGHSWRSSLKALLKSSASPSLGVMGFPNGWESLPIWR